VPARSASADPAHVRDAIGAAAAGGAGFGLYSPLAIVIIGGLVTSTLIAAS